MPASALRRNNRTARRAPILGDSKMPPSAAGKAVRCRLAEGNSAIRVGFAVDGVGPRGGTGPVGGIRGSAWPGAGRRPAGAERLGGHRRSDGPQWSRLPGLLSPRRVLALVIGRLISSPCESGWSTPIAATGSSGRARRHRRQPAPSRASQYRARTQGSLRASAVGGRKQDPYRGVGPVADGRTSRRGAALRARRCTNRDYAVRARCNW